MKKNSKESFAAKAKKIINTYKRASFDKNEKAELDAALQKLSEEQEQYKMANKIGEYSDEAMAQKAMQQQQMMAQQMQGQVPQGSPLGYPQGQPMQPDSQVGQMVGQPQEPPQFWAGTKDINDPYGLKSQSSISYNNGFNSDGSVGVIDNSSLYGKYNPNLGIVDNNIQYNNNLLGYNGINTNSNKIDYQYKNPTYLDTKDYGTSGVAQPTQSIVGQDQQIGQTQSILPSVIAGGIGMIGNSLLAANVKDNQFNQSYSADQISLAKERERLSREATTARNIGMRNLSGAGSRGAYLAGAGNVSAGVNQQLGDALSQSYFREGMTNLQQREKAAELNRQVAMMNYQAKINAQNERAGYMAAVAGIPTQTMQDIGQINYQNSALLSSGTDNYIAGTNSKQNPWANQKIYRKFKK